METKSASDTLETFKVILQDINNHTSVASQQAHGDTTSIQQHTENSSPYKSHSVDHAATEIKFNKLLEDYRKEVLPW